jgi:hypothetical protein
MTDRHVGHPDAALSRLPGCHGSKRSCCRCGGNRVAAPAASKLVELMRRKAPRGRIERDTESTRRTNNCRRLRSSYLRTARLRDSPQRGPRNLFCHSRLRALLLDDGLLRVGCMTLLRRNIFCNASLALAGHNSSFTAHTRAASTAGVAASHSRATLPGRHIDELADSGSHDAPDFVLLQQIDQICGWCFR